MRKPFIIESLILLLAATFALWGCSRTNEADIALDRADAVIEEHPDSAMAIIDAIDTLQLTSGERRARYALLKSMALDKNYVDLTTMKVLQPAIDQYITQGKGTPTDRMRTYYYQGRIYENAGKLYDASRCFVYGKKFGSLSTDRLTHARICISLGTLAHRIYQYLDAMGHFLEAAEWYEKTDAPALQFDALKKAHTCAIEKNLKPKADSIMGLIRSMPRLSVIPVGAIKGVELHHYANLGFPEEIREAIEEYLSLNQIDMEGLLDLAKGYVNLGETANALQCINAIPEDDKIRNTTKFLSLITTINMESGADKEALHAYMNLSEKIDSVNTRLFSQDIIVSEAHHKSAIGLLEEYINRGRIAACIIAICVVVGLAFMAFFILRHLNTTSRKHLKHLRIQQELDKTKMSLKLAKQLEESTHKNQELKQDKEELKQNNEELRQSNQSLKQDNEELKQSNQELKQDNEELKQTNQELKQDNECTDKAIKMRLDLIHSLLIAIIARNDRAETRALEQLKALTSNSTKFMKETRLILSSSYPRFISYLQERGLTDSEINHACLYALGLNGKDLGAFADTANQYNVSSQIRKKLGLTQHDTNLSLYLKKLLKETRCAPQTQEESQP